MPVFLGFPSGSDRKGSSCTVGYLGWEDRLEEGMATHSCMLAWSILTDRGAWWATIHGVTKSQTHLRDSGQHSTCIVGFPGGSVVKNPLGNAGDPGSGKFPGEGNGNLLQCSCLENPHGQRSLVGCSPCGCKESDTTEQLSTSTWEVMVNYLWILI